MSIFTANFGKFPVRFVSKGAEVFVCKADLLAALRDCFTENTKSMAEGMFDIGLSMVGDAKDRQAATLGDSEIGPVVHFHAVGNLLNSLSDLTDVDSAELRETSFRVNALWRWYCSTLGLVDDFFGRTLKDLLTSVKTRLDRIAPPFVAEVVFDVESGMWVASCDELSVATEAPSYEAVTERFWEIAPEIAHDNGIDFDESSRIQFRHVEGAAGRIRAAY